MKNSALSEGIGGGTGEGRKKRIEMGRRTQPPGCLYSISILHPAHLLHVNDRRPDVEHLERPVRLVVHQGSAHLRSRCGAALRRQRIRCVALVSLVRPAAVAHLTPPFPSFLSHTSGQVTSTAFTRRSCWPLNPGVV